jgi:hypothetical protein
MPCWDALILAKAECGLVHVWVRTIGTIATKEQIATIPRE